MGEHLAFLLRGLGSGGVFAALAMALVVTYRSSGVVNFATGAIALYVAETYAYLRNGELFVPFPGLPSTVDVGGELPFPVAALAALVVAAVLGLLLHYLVFRPLRNAPAVAKAVASVGVMIVLQAVIAIRLGTNPITTPAILPDATVDIFGEAVRTDRIWFALAVVGIAAACAVLFNYTSFGLATRAAAETEKGALVTGLSPERIARVNWALSAVVAGIAGILISPIVAIIPVSYTLFIVPALAAALVGGFTRVGPAVAAGLMIGMLQSELVFLQSTQKWLPAAGLPELLPLVLILVMLVLRGRPLPERGALVTKTLGRAPKPNHVAANTVVWAGLGLAAVLLTSGGYRAAMIFTFIFALVALSWVVVTGYAGQVSLAQLALAGVGAFSLHRFATQLDVPFPIAPLLAAAAATVIGVIVGLPALRIRGLPVAVVTLALAVAVEGFWFLNGDLNGGLTGAPIEPPSLFGYELRVDPLSSRLPFALMCLGVLTLAALGVAWLRRSRLGAAMLAVKANERSAAAAGIHVARTKMIAFAIGAYIAGLAGCLLAYMQAAAIPQSYNAVLGVGLFALVYLSGITSISGGINAGVIAAGGIVFTYVDRTFDFGLWYTVVAGLLLVLTVIQNPEGVMGKLHQQLAGRRRSRSVAGSPALAVAAPAAARVGPASLDPDRPILLQVRQLSVHYGGVTAVDGVSIDVPEGLIVGLIGPNGAGKTTLIDAISGYAACEGRIDFDGHDLAGKPPYQRARLGLGRTFQGVELYEDLTVEENIGVGQAAARGRATAEGSGIDDLCALLGLDEVRARPVRELSAGYRQLVSVARALAGQPRLLMLDEPAGGLDTDESRWLGERLAAIRAAGTTVVMIDHDMSLVLGVCDLIHVLDLGRVIASGPPSAIRADARVSAAYLGGSATPNETDSVSTPLEPAPDLV